MNIKRVPNTHMFILSGDTRSHAPLFRCGVSSPPPSTLCCYNLPMATSCRIAVVGDVVIIHSLSLSTISLLLFSFWKMLVFHLFFLFKLKHDDWNLEEDTKALQLLKVSLSLSLSVSIHVLKYVGTSICFRIIDF